jgi:Cu2+-exporting ATPase
MKCAGCVSAVEKTLTEHPAVADASVNLVTAKATVKLRDSQEKDDAIADDLSDIVTGLGFPTTVVLVNQPPATSIHTHQHRFTQENDDESEESSSRFSRWIARQDHASLAIAAVLLFFSSLGHLKHLGLGTVPGLSNIWFHFGLATIALLVPGQSILVDGWRSLRHGFPNMNTLVGMGMTASYSASLVALLIPSLGWECFFDEPVMLVGFILLGRSLESGARARAKQSIESLFSRQPQVARLIERTEPDSAHADGSAENIDTAQSTFTEIPTQTVQIGQWLKVLPGDQVPVDGTVISGQTTINESILTGEALPVEKAPGDRVSAGSLNQSGAIVIQATRVGQETTLSKMIQLVEAAQTRKAPVQKLADTVAGYFAYGVMAIATVTFLFWYVIGTHLWPHVLLEQGAGMSHAAMGIDSMAVDSMASATSPLLLSLKLAIAVLVVACPCALGLATPTAIMVGSGMGAERGLLIRGGDVLEAVNRLDTVVFDKTGTLTIGQPVVNHIEVFSAKWSDEEVLAIAASAEQETQHPIGQAIQSAAKERSLPDQPVSEVQTAAGAGIKATFKGMPLYVGKRSWLQQQIEWRADTQETLNHAEARLSGSAVLVALGTEVLGIIGIDDQLRSDAHECVQALQAMNIEVKILTGDRQRSAEPIAASLGLSGDALMADVKPEQKSDIVKTLQHNQHVVCMVGDGINDAPVLAQADVGIAMHSGTDVAIETSDIVLMRDQLRDVAASIQLGRQVIQKVRQNLFWALAYNTLGIPVAAGVLLPAWGILLSPANAGALMAFSSVSVVVNALLLRRSKVGERLD